MNVVDEETKDKVNVKSKEMRGKITQGKKGRQI